MKKYQLLLVIIVMISMPAHSRDTIRVVGSSTVYPFATVVAETFGRQDNGFKTPIIAVSYTHLTLPTILLV